MSGLITIGVLLVFALIAVYCGDDEPPPEDWDAEAWKLWKRRGS